MSSIITAVRFAGAREGPSAPRRWGLLRTHKLHSDLYVGRLEGPAATIAADAQVRRMYLGQAG
ncbi:MAG: hypothetical protein QN174_11585 [Armatimonadota bacterium]|nr:hypothetical protein [Armatimonadota bacterium]